MQKLISKNNVVANSNLLAGIALGTVSTYVPFALTFSLSRFAHLTAQSFSTSNGAIAGLGLAAVIIASVAIYDCRKSTKSMLGVASVVFAILGVFVSLTV
jgi:hypothetical protein